MNRMKYLVPIGFAASDRDAIRQSVFDPRGQYADVSNPERLFVPSTCIKLGAIMDAKADVTLERTGPLALAWDQEGIALAFEESCSAGRPSQCSWQRLWKRRLRTFNTGSEAGNDGGVVIGTRIQGGYANDVISSSPRFEAHQ